MREGRPSATATYVAWARSIAGVDPIAERLVPARMARFARAGSRSLARFPLVDMMRLRTIAIDDAVKDAVRDGTTQVVVLGAGLCARAWRLPELSGSIVYEVDHPATQQYKRRRLERITAKAQDVRFVAVDFEKDDLSIELEKAGHDASTRTTWIWEGVTPYLTPQAILSTVAKIRARSANGSVLALTYFTPARNRYRLVGVRLALRMIGEPFRGLMSVESMHRLLETNGFDVKDDAAYAELAKRLALPAPRPTVATGERVLVAKAAGPPNVADVNPI
jgi:methyltransferase (TIGR00027 family)